MTNSNDIEFLLQLEEVIASRKFADAEVSYTARLFREGIGRIAQKIGEEGVELALAGVQQNKEEIRAEAADLLYHLLVLLQSQDMNFSEVVGELKARHD